MKKGTLKKTITEKYKYSTKTGIAVYLTIRFIIIGILIRQIFLGEWNNVFLCCLSLALLFIPLFLQDTLKVDLPDAIEISVFVFVFAAEILGEFANFYGNISFWDTMLHTVTGFLAASVGFGAIDLLNTHSKRLSMTPLFVALVSFCFSMTVGVLWEFGEHAVDRLLGTDTQKDRIITEISSVALNPDGKNKEVRVNGISYTVIYDENGEELARIDGGYLDIGLRDTMKDMIVNMIGAIVFSIFGYLYIHRRDKYKFAEKFIILPVKAEEEKEEVPET